MLSIGEIAHLTGVSRRMLRHWEEVGLIVPAAIDDARVIAVMGGPKSVECARSQPCGRWASCSRRFVVTAGTANPEQAGAFSPLRILEIAGCERGVTVRFETPPASIGDAWISLDATLEQQHLETTGVYRQTLTPRAT